MGLLDEIVKYNQKTKEETEKREKQAMQEDMDLYDLDEFERKQVVEEEYDPWNFEKEPDYDTNEDDFYYEEEK